MSISVLQSAISAIQSSSLAFTSNVTAGNLLIAALGNSAGGSLTGFSDTLGNAWTLARFGSTGSDALWFYYAIANASGPCTITAVGVGWGAPSYSSALAVAEITGAFTDTIDTDSNRAAPPPLTLSVVDDFAVTAAFSHFVVTPPATVAGGETLLESVFATPSGFAGAMALSWVPGLAVGSFTSGLSLAGEYVSVAFKAGSSPPPPPPSPTFGNAAY
jgi:hypothetical protein